MHRVRKEHEHLRRQFAGVDKDQDKHVTLDELNEKIRKEVARLVDLYFKQLELPPDQTAAVEAVRATLTALRNGTQPGDLKGLASAGTMAVATDAARYQKDSDAWL